MLIDVCYAAPTDYRPRYHANDRSRDRLEIERRAMEAIDGRAAGASLDAEGFALFPHKTAVADWRDDRMQAVYRDEIAGLIASLTGADSVVVTSPGILRFSERSRESGTLNNSRPARFAHVDINDETAAQFAQRAAPAPFVRAAHYNVWRVISPPPQDAPLALCDAASVDESDLIEADAVFDEPGKADWSFTGLVVRANPRHRWLWFPDMIVNEAIVFKTNDSEPGAPHCVPHVAFDNPLCPDDAPARTSVEIRAIAYWLSPPREN